MIEAQLKTERFKIRGMHCANCALTIEGAVGTMPGVREANVNFAAETLTVRAAESVAKKTIEACVAEAGYQRVIRDGKEIIVPASELAHR